MSSELAPTILTSLSLPMGTRRTPLSIGSRRLDPGCPGRGECGLLELGGWPGLDERGPPESGPPTFTLLLLGPILERDEGGSWWTSFTSLSLPFFFLLSASSSLS